MDNIIVCPNCKNGIHDLFFGNHQQYCLAMTDIVEG